MKLLWPTSFIALAAFAVNPGLAQAVEPATASEAAKAADDSKLVCKTKTGTGTRFSKKTCMTHAQWDAVRIQNQRDLKEVADRPLIETQRPPRGE